MVLSIRRTSGWRTIGTDSPASSRPCFRISAYADACWKARSAIATPCKPVESRASFIIVNMQARPLFGLPTNQPIAPSRSPKAMLQVGLAWMPSLCSMPVQRTSLRADSPLSDAGNSFGTRNSEMPFGAGGRSRQTRQHEMDDVVREIVFPVGDEDLLATQPERVIPVRLGTRADRAQVGAGLRFGEAHGRGPLAAHELGQIDLAERIIGVRQHHVNGALRQHRCGGEAHIGAGPHLHQRRTHRAWHTAPAPLLRAR